MWCASIATAIATYSIVFLLVFDGVPRLQGTWRATIPGATNALGTVLQMFALTVLFVPYVIAIKRLSSLVTVIVSGMIFGEQTKDRLIGTMIMLLGTILLALGS